MKKLPLLLYSILIIFLLEACGQAGPLYLPDQKSPNPTSPSGQH